MSPPEQEEKDLKKAEIVSVPQEILFGQPGWTIFAEFELKNNSDEPYEPGCYL